TAPEVERPAPLPSRPVGRSLAPELRGGPPAGWGHPLPAEAPAFGTGQLPPRTPLRPEPRPEPSPAPAYAEPTAEVVPGQLPRVGYDTRPAGYDARPADPQTTGYDARQFGSPVPDDQGADDWAEPPIERPGWVQPSWAQPPVGPRAFGGPQPDPGFGDPANGAHGRPGPEQDAAPAPLWQAADPFASPLQTPPAGEATGEQGEVPVVASVLLPLHADPGERLPDDPGAPTIDDLFPSPQHPFAEASTPSGSWPAPGGPDLPPPALTALPLPQRGAAVPAPFTAGPAEDVGQGTPPGAGPVPGTRLPGTEFPRPAPPKRWATLGANLQDRIAPPAERPGPAPAPPQDFMPPQTTVAPLPPDLPAHPRWQAPAAGGELPGRWRGGPSAQHPGLMPGGPGSEQPVSEHPVSEHPGAESPIGASPIGEQPGVTPFGTGLLRATEPPAGGFGQPPAPGFPEPPAPGFPGIGPAGAGAPDSPEIWPGTRPGGPSAPPSAPAAEGWQEPAPGGTAPWAAPVQPADPAHTAPGNDTDPPWGTPPDLSQPSGTSTAWDFPAAQAPADESASYPSSARPYEERAATPPAPVGWPLAGSEPAPWSQAQQPWPTPQPWDQPAAPLPTGSADVPAAQDQAVPPGYPFDQQDPPANPGESIARRRALLGRGSGHGGGSALLRRLGGRKSTSLGPGGTSAELISLGSGHPVSDPRGAGSGELSPPPDVASQIFGTAPQAPQPYPGDPAAAWGQTQAYPPGQAPAEQYAPYPPGQAYPDPYREAMAPTGHVRDEAAEEFAATADAFGVAVPATPEPDPFRRPPTAPFPPAPGAGQAAQAPAGPLPAPAPYSGPQTYPPLPAPLLGAPEPDEPASYQVAPPFPAPDHPAAEFPAPEYAPPFPAPEFPASGGSELPGGQLRPAAALVGEQTGPAGGGELTGLLAGLARRSGELFGVVDTAQVLAEDLVERAQADAAAVLVPDGPVWRVSGGIGLLPQEQQTLLDTSHWLVSEIALGGQVLVLQDTALARPKLAGAPLATWRHLLAIPVPQVHALVMLARGPAARPFGEADLARVVGPVAEAAGLLSTAIQTRQLARMLAPLREDGRGPAQ
ncbi:MAG TPA: hypothetical protein VFP72_22890, partial [Kineosporiaceae bacterium]|nr:hypothetical protein [Kineosporiaceae bacterium]